MSNYKLDSIIREIESLYDDDEGSVREELYEILLPLTYNDYPTSYDDYSYEELFDGDEY